MKRHEQTGADDRQYSRLEPTTYRTTVTGLRVAEIAQVLDTPPPTYHIPESPRSGLIAAETAGMIGGLLIERADKQAGIHPDAIHAKMASYALQSVISGVDDNARLRVAPVDELMDRPLRYAAIDPAIAGEDAHVGGIYVKQPVGEEQYAEISTMYLDEDHRGNGASRRMISTAATDTLMAGWTPSAFAANKHAQAAFERAGFEQVDVAAMPTQPYNQSAEAYVMPPDSAAADNLIMRHIDSTTFDTPDQRAQTLEHFGLAEHEPDMPPQ